MKTRKLILSVILILAVLGFVGNSTTPKNAYAQEKPTIEDLVGTWVNEKSIQHVKWIIKPDGNVERYKYIDSKWPTHPFKILIIKDSWVDKDGNKYLKALCREVVGGEPIGCYWFSLWRTNELGTVLEWNAIEDFEPRLDDVPEKYPTEIDPNSYDFIYRIYYRQ